MFLFPGMVIRIGLDTNLEDKVSMDDFLAEVAQFQNKFEDSELTFVGDGKKVADSKSYSLMGKFDSVDAPEKLEADAKLSHLVRRFKRPSNHHDSISQGLVLLIGGKIDVFVSGASTGPLTTAASCYPIHKKIKFTPAYCLFPTILPDKDIAYCDVGANVKATHNDLLVNYLLLRQELINLGIENPQIALLNIGTEKVKGGAYKQIYDFFENLGLPGFAGNAEPNNAYFNTKIDGLVCDAFVGNIALKKAEGTHRFDVTILSQIVKKMAQAGEIKPESAGKIVQGLISYVDLKSRTGAPFLGCEYKIVLNHGEATPYGALKIGYEFAKRPDRKGMIIDTLEHYKKHMKFFG